ncbi:hypothetical protein GmRootV118_58340 [Variovorax sp. V118]|jgi:hypothetical protein
MNRGRLTPSALSRATFALSIGLAAVLTACGGGGGGGSGSGFPLVGLPVAPAPAPAPPAPSPPAPAPSYSISGKASGLKAPLNLRLNGADEFTVKADGAFTAPVSIAANNPYEITVAAQPVGSQCAVINGSGTITAPVTNVQVVCSALAYAVGGNVTGLTGNLVLQSGGQPDLTVNANGPFVFRDPFPHGAAYAVSVKTMPAGQTCVVSNGTGTVAGVVSSIVATCSDIPPVPVPATPDQLSYTASVKAYNFTWTAVPGATYYRISLDSTGTSTFDLIADNIKATAFSLQNIELTNPPRAERYGLQACNESGCSAYSHTLAVPSVQEAIGYFKPSSGAAGHMEFGRAMAVSRDGNWMVVGAAGTGAGFVELYSRRSGQWAFETRLTASNADTGDAFGTSVAISEDGSAVLVGATGESSSAVNVGGNKFDNVIAGAGAAYVFERSGSTWTEAAYLKSGFALMNENFGLNVALSADGSIAWVSGNGLALQGYQKSAGAWSRFNSGSYATSGAARSLAVSADGLTLVVGLPNDPSALNNSPNDSTAPGAGAVLVMKWTIPTITAMYYLKAATPEAGANFGASVAVSADGRVVAAGSPLKTVTGLAKAGAVTLFTFSGVDYSRGPDVNMTTPAGGPVAGVDFGRSVSLSSDGMVLAVGAPLMSALGTGINPLLQFGAPAYSGVAFLFANKSGTWTPTAWVTTAPMRTDAHLGQAVSLSGNGKTLGVGAPGEQSLGNGIGGDESKGSDIGVGAAFLF